jgi:ATP synthase F1 delta subunit
MNVEFVVAKKYATAFLALAGSSCDEHEINAMERLQQFLKHNREILFFFNLPLIQQDVKEAVLEKLAADLKTKPLFEKLVNLLSSDRRALLIPLVLGYIGSLYRERNTIVAFAVSSSHELSQEDKKIMEQFLASHTGKKIDASYTVDTKLIAGIRALSSTHKWEQSVRGELMMIRRSLTEQGVLWN